MQSLLGLAVQLATAAADARLAEEVIIERACELLEAEAKRVIGTYDPGWPPLQPETIARKATGDSPLLEIGELRDSITHNMTREFGEVVGYVGSDNEKAVWHEFGTRTAPPRPFLGWALNAKEREIEELAGRLMFGAVMQSSPYYRELRELMHILKHLYHEVKEFGRDLVDEDKEGK
jgi:phage gpG-like protein